jgi:hypothetical protein
MYSIFRGTAKGKDFIGFSVKLIKQFITVPEYVFEIRETFLN